MSDPMAFLDETEDQEASPLATDRQLPADSLLAADRLRLEELCRQFLAISRRKLTGTLVVTSTQGETKSFLCHHGAIADLDPGREETFLTQILLGCEDISPRQTKKAQKHAEKNATSLGAALLELGAVNEESLLRAIEERVALEVTEAFEWELESSSFRSHEADAVVEGFVSDLSDYFDLLADPETLFLEACQRIERWDLVECCFDLLLDVFYATPGTFQYFRDPETYQTEIRVLGSIDGTRDIQEVVDESGLDPFVAVDVVRNLIREGAIELINPVQMFQLGTQAESQGNVSKASRLYQRSMDRGLSDFDVDLRFAQTLESLGRKEEAAANYFTFSNKCLAQLRVDDAIRSLRRVVQLSPDEGEAMQKLVALLIQHNRAEEALNTAIAFAERLEQKGDVRDALDLLICVQNSKVREVRLHERIIELAESCGDHEISRQTKELIAEHFDGRRDAAHELASYQREFCDGNDSLEVRLKLINLHKEQGSHHKAIDHINAVLNQTGRQKPSDPDTLLELNLLMRDLQPADVRANKFLIDHHLRQKEKEHAIAILQSWLPELQKTGDDEELVAALQRLIELSDCTEYRWILATAFRKMNRVEECHDELRRLAEHAMRRKEFDQAAKALEDILRATPLDIVTRKAVADLHELRGERELATEKLKELATLEIIAGHVQEAETYSRQILNASPDDASIVEHFGKLCEETGDEKKAEEQFVKAARIHVENRNLGMARRLLEKILKNQPQHGEGNSLMATLSNLEDRLTAKPQAAAPAATKPEETSPALSVKSEPFQSPTPVKTSVSGITARLRSLKGGDEPAKPSANSRGGKTVPAVANIAAKLKSLGSGSSPSKEPSTETPVAADTAPPKSEASAKSSGGSASPLKSAAARLKALSSNKSEASESKSSAASDAGESSEGQAAPGAAPPSAKIKQKLGSSASRLAALRKSAE